MAEQLGKRHIGIIGAGVAGLTVAYRRHRAGDRVSLFEAAPRIGGQLHSERRDGFLVEHGAEGFVAGSQALADAMVSFDCHLSEARLVGTHHIFIGQVMGIRSRVDGNALLYFDRSYVNVPTQVGSFGG